LEKYINLFWKDVIASIKDNQHVLLIIRIKFENNQILSLAPHSAKQSEGATNMQTINLFSKDILLGFIKDKFHISNDNYKITPITSVIFSFGNREGVFKYSLNQSSNKNIKYQVYYKNELPIAMVRST
jgi:hypothetical protein